MDCANSPHGESVMLLPDTNNVFHPLSLRCKGVAKTINHVVDYKQLLNICCRWPIANILKSILNDGRDRVFVTQKKQVTRSTRYVLWYPLCHLLVFSFFSRAGFHQLSKARHCLTAYSTGWGIVRRPPLPWNSVQPRHTPAETDRKMAPLIRYMVNTT